VFPKKCQKKTSDPFAVEAYQFTSSHTLQHDVEVEIEGVDKSGGFIGTLFLKNGDNLGVLLLEHGFGTLHQGSANGSNYVNQYYSAENRAKAAKKNIWKNYSEAAEKQKREEKTEKAAEMVDVLVTEILKDGQFYVQIIGSNVQTLEAMTKDFRTLHLSVSQDDPILNYTPKKGDMCSAQFTLDNQWYRARIVRVLPTDQVEVLYVDYGNSETLGKDRIRALPSQFGSLAHQAHLNSLAAIKLPKDEDVLNEALVAFGQATNGKKLKAQILGRVEKVAEVVLYDNIENETSYSFDQSINYDLVQNGLFIVEKKDQKRYPQLVSALLEAQQSAASSRLMIWRYGDVTEDDDDFGANRRRNNK